jgi:TatD DNase family protein
MLQYLDCHNHLADSRLWPQTESLCREAAEAGVTVMLVVAAQVGDWARLSQLATACGTLQISRAYGVHPWYAEQWTTAVEQELDSLLRSGVAVAVGECGLDFQHGRENAEQQMSVLRTQLRLAEIHRLPVILHVRKAWPEMLQMLGEYPALPGGICHNFSGSLDIARQLLPRNFLFSFGGDLTKDGFHQRKQVATALPDNAILTETDAPDCPVLGKSPGTGVPADVVAVTAALAALRHTTIQDLCDTLHANWQCCIRPIP